MVFLPIEYASRVPIDIMSINSFKSKNRQSSAFIDGEVRHFRFHEAVFRRCRLHEKSPVARIETAGVLNLGSTLVNGLNMRPSQAIA